MDKETKKLLKKAIKKASKKEYPLSESENLFNVDSHSYERPAFVAGAEWAIKQLSTETGDFINGQIDLINFMFDKISEHLDFPPSLNTDPKKVLQDYNKQK